MRTSFLVRTVPSLAAAGMLMASNALSTQHGGHSGDLGVVDFQVSCAPAVRSDFDRAVALLHHMMYVEAKAAFEGIAAREIGSALWPTGASR